MLLVIVLPELVEYLSIIIKIEDIEYTFPFVFFLTIVHARYILIRNILAMYYLLVCTRHKELLHLRVYFLIVERAIHLLDIAVYRYNHY